MTIVLAATAGLLFAIGTYLILQRKLSRIIIGLGLLTHGANLLLITSGRRGRAPIIDGRTTTYSDPLPQALALTSIVITFAVTALLLALAYRSWVLTADDEVEDDVGDRDVARGGALQKEIADQERSLAEAEADEAEAAAADTALAGETPS